MLGMEELKANAAKVKSRITSGHGWDGHLFSGLLSWYCPVSNGHGAKRRVVSIILYSPLLLSQETNRAKYPIAAADKLIHTSGANILFAYDIGCTFSATLSKSLISKLASNFNFRSCTGSFHGAAHNWLCQLCFHIGLTEIRTNMSIWVSLSYILHIPTYNFYIIKGTSFWIGMPRPWYS